MSPGVLNGGVPVDVGQLAQAEPAKGKKLAQLIFFQHNLPIARGLMVFFQLLSYVLSIITLSNALLINSATSAL